MAEKSIADQITEGTKNEVEKSGGTYKPTNFNDDDPVSHTEAERKQFGEQLVGQIKVGTKEQKKYDKWYEETYGSKNSHVSSFSDPL